MSDEELEIPEDGDEEEDEELEEIEYVYGIAMPDLIDDIQPLECCVLVKGIFMSTGEPTIIALTSDGMTPWEAAGMLQMEASRLIQQYAFHGTGLGFVVGEFEDDEEEDEDD